MFSLNSQELSCSEILTNKFGTKYDKSTFYFIILQGPTSAGKTTLSKDICNLLADVNPFLLSLDNFYDFPYCVKDEAHLDYDNPKMLNWENIYKVINSLLQEESIIPIYTRPGENKETLTYVKNSGYKIIVIEGVYAFNCINDVIFNISEFDGYDSTNKITQEYIKNTKIKEISRPIKTINCLLTQSRNKMYKLRIQKDCVMRNLSEEEVLRRLDKYTWPGTLKWVYSKKFQKDLVIKNGNFNQKKVHELKRSLRQFFVD